MEKSVAVAATNEEVKVSNQLQLHIHIPDDLAFSILSKLPLKCLKRFGSVRKSWALLFENPHFMNMYRNNFLSNDHSYYDATSLLLHQKIYASFESYYFENKFELYSLSGERFENRVKLDWPHPSFQEDDYSDSGFGILGPGCINGTFCLLCNFLVNIVLWNPATKEFKVIPPSPLDAGADHHGFGYDPIRDDYKVIRRAWTECVSGGLPCGDISYDSFWEIYSVRSNSWRKLDVDMPLSASNDNQQVYMDGLCHWWSKSETHNEAYLVSFDSGNEVFFTTLVPSDMDDSFDYSWVWRHLMILNGSIAFILNDLKTSTFHISILGELGVKESWTKLFIVGPLPCLEYPIGAGKKGNIFFIKKDGELAWFDLSTQMIEELGIKGDRFNFKIVIYKENLLPIGGTNN